MSRFWMQLDTFIWENASVTDAAFAEEDGHSEWFFTFSVKETWCLATLYALKFIFMGIL